MKKNILALITILLLICSVAVAGCGKKEDKEETKPAATQTEQQPKENSPSQQEQQADSTPSDPAQSTENQATGEKQNTDNTATAQEGNKTSSTSANQAVDTNKQTPTPKNQTPAASTAKPKPAETPRIDQYFFSMPQRFLPDKAKDVSCIYQFNITDGNKGKYIVTIKDGKCTVSKGTAAKADITINTGEQLWLDIATDKANGTTAYLTRKFTAEGNTDYLSNMKKYFKKFEG